MMSRKQKRRVYAGLVAAVLVLFAAGLAVGYGGRHSTLCRDGKPPRQQQDLGIQGVRYLCHDGQLVTNK
jgi:hypothetical protein